MTEPATPCRTCGVAHAWTHEHGWRATNGHPLHAYDKRDSREPIRIGKPDNDGYHRFLGTAFVTCDACKCLLLAENMDGHDAWHSQLADELGALWDAVNGKRKGAA